VSVFVVGRKVYKYKTQIYTEHNVKNTSMWSTFYVV